MTETAHRSYDSHAGDGGPVQNPGGSHDAHDGAAHARDDGQTSNGGPVHDGHDSQIQDGGAAHNLNDSPQDDGGPAQIADDSQPRDGGAAVPWEGTADLRAAAESVADAIKNRVGVTNRAGQVTATVDSELALLQVELAKEYEDKMRDILGQAYQVHVPQAVRDWAATVPGLASGELFPRICGITGNPRVATPFEWPEGAAKPVPAGPPRHRTLRQFWQWAGCGDPYSKPYADLLGHPVTRADKLAAGKLGQLRPLLYVWSSYLLRAATPVTKEGSPKFGQPMSEAAAASRYWKVFQEARESAQHKVHERQCRNRKRAPFSNGCGTVLHPEWGEPGSPWRPGHVLRHAHRIAQKELLRDFWRAAE